MSVMTAPTSSWKWRLSFGIVGDPDALILDRERGIYADPEKVHYLNHVGKWFQSRGPLNIPQGPQGRPVVIQAGSSGRGKAFAARWSEVIFALQPNIERMRVFTDEVHEALAQQGRARDASRILMSIMPFVGETRAEAEDKRDLHDSLVDPLVGLSTLGAHANADFSNLALDDTIEAVISSGSQGNIAALKSIAAGKSMSIADAGRIYGRGVMCPRLVGTAKDIADEMAEIVLSGAADGFVVSPAFLPDTFEDFVDGVVPILQQKGLFRNDYEGTMLRDHLGLSDRIS